MKSFLDLASEELDRLYRFVRSRVGSEDESRDVMQDVFMALTARWNLGETIEDGLAWLFRTARNKIVDRYRRRRRGEVSLDALAAAEEGAGRGIFDLADARTATPEEHAQREELREALLEAIETLPREQREVLVLTVVEGRTFREIAASTGDPLNTLLSRKRYAMQKLRRILSERFDLEEV